jgi:hypothetical protein
MYYSKYNINSDEDFKSDLSNPETSWCDLKCVAYSPCITVGVNYNP